jgi:16S rRNA G527 N7-methylase RsmG
MTDPGPAQLASVLGDGARELGIALDGACIERLIALGALLLDWNTRINLTAIREPLDFAR